MRPITDPITIPVSSLPISKTKKVEINQPLKAKKLEEKPSNMLGKLKSMAVKNRG
jgi:hypothetical protein